MSEVTEQKLTKKQLKALEFKKNKGGEKDITKEKKPKLNADEVYAPISEKELVKSVNGEDDEKKVLKKRKREESEGDKEVKEAKPKEGSEKKSKKKTKKAKKPKTESDSQTTSTDKSTDKPEKPAEKANRFIVFIGNLPYDCTADELTKHFKAASPAAIRLRKGFAFAEFDGKDATKKLNVAIRLHHTIFKERKINVELTAGGGGNTEARRKKIQIKNDKLREEHAQRISKEQKAADEKKNDPNASSSSPAPAIHPSRLKLLQ